jgi:hypothetical protein
VSARALCRRYLTGPANPDEPTTLAGWLVFALVCLVVFGAWAGWVWMVARVGVWTRWYAFDAPTAFAAVISFGVLCFCAFRLLRRWAAAP